MQIYPITQTDPPTFPLRREKGRVLLWNRNSRPLSPQTSTFDVRVFPETIVLRRLPSSQMNSEPLPLPRPRSNMTI